MLDQSSSEEKTGGGFKLGKFGPARIRTEVLAGLTVAMALVPEAVAFAFVAGLAPLSGLYAAFIVGLVTAIFGGRPGMISGATGALAVVMVSLVATHGPEYLFATVVLMGILQMLAGALHLGKFIRLVPYPVMLGFVNGLAIVIFLAQFEQFKIADGHGGHAWMQGRELILMLGLAFLTMIVVWGSNKLTKAVPAPLTGILVTTGVVLGFGLDVRNVGDMASIAGGLPSFSISGHPVDLGNPDDHPAPRVDHGGDRLDRKPADDEPGGRDHRDPRQGQPGVPGPGRRQHRHRVSSAAWAAAR